MESILAICYDCRTMFQRLSALLILLCLASGALRADAAPSGLYGTFEHFQVSRPKLSWEELKGYRLFFHPDDIEPLRRSLNLAIPSEHKVLDAYSLVRPLLPNPEMKDAWLRVEGVVTEDRISFEWDGSYRGAEFPDGPYYYEVVHVHWTDGDSLDQTVVILKSKDHPRLVKVGSVDLEEHALLFRQGEYVPDQLAATISKAEFPQVPLIAKALVPSLEDIFSCEGIQVSYKLVGDADGKKPKGAQEWNCACQAPLDPGSPARKAAKKVRCDWDLSGVAPGLYDLRLSLYHKFKHPAQIDPCDTPVLDEDRIRVLVQP